MGGGKSPSQPQAISVTIRSTVPYSSYAIFLTGAVLEAAICWRIVKGRLWRYYPVFTAYIAYVIAQSGAGFLAIRYAPSSYPAWYWVTGITNIFLRFLLIWEVFRLTFPETSPLRRILSRQSAVKSLALITVLTALLWAVESYDKSHSVYLATERSFGFVQAVLILGVVTLARYYQLHLGRNLWGIAVAFGLYCSLSTVAAAGLELARLIFFPYWYLLSPLSFVAMLGIWTWAVWTYAPNRALGTDGTIDPTRDLGVWSENWGRAVSTIRKVSNP